MNLLSSTMQITTDMDFSEYSTTTATNTPSSDDDLAPCNNWNHWSPLVNWDAVAAPHDDFHHLVDSMMDYSATLPLSPHASTSPSTSAEDDENATTTAEDDHDEPPQPLPATATTTRSVDADHEMKGVRLVHLLLAAAEAIAGPTKSRDLARVILLRLKDLVPLAAAAAAATHASNMERLAVHFIGALHALLEGTAAGGAHSNNNKQRDDPKDTVAAFQLLQDMSPYVKFAHFTCNQAIVEAVGKHRRVHIVDYDIMEGIQWASLMQALASNNTGSPGPHLRITALSRTGTGRRSIASVQETGRRLMAFAASLGQPFSFHQCRLDSDETFLPHTLKLVRGEALLFNCMLDLPHLTYRTPHSVLSFLNGAKSLKPVLVTLVEEDGMVRRDGGFLGRFMDSLHHYSAFYDSLEAGFPMQGRALTLVERVFLGPMIAGSLLRMYRTSTGEDVERGSWWEWLGAAGFKGVPVSFANHLQAKLLLSLFNDGYVVGESAANKLVLGWRSRPMLSVSIWTTSSD